MSGGEVSRERQDAAATVHALLHARSIAVVGASADPMKPSGRVLRYLRRYGFSGRVFGVNPARDEAQGYPCFPSLAALPETPELAVITLPAAAIADALRACGDAGVRTAIVFASGFAEAGDEGRALQEATARAAREAGVRVLGPNSNGVIGVRDAVLATFMSGVDTDDLELRDDGVAFVSQSGALGAFIFQQAQSSGLGVGAFLSIGNEMDLTLSEALSGLVDDPDVRVVLAYVEGLGDPEALRDALERARARDLPVVLMKVGRSARGAEAAASHTGALAGSDAVFDGFLRQHGVVRVTDIDEMLDLARLLAFTPPLGGRRLSVITLSGGAGVMVADAADDLGLSVPPWEGEWLERMTQALPAYASPVNPIDVTGALLADPQLLRASLDVAIAHPGTDAIVVVLGNLQSVEETCCSMIADAAGRTDKPVVTVWVGGTGRVPRMLAERGLPAFTDPGRAMRALAAVADRAGLAALPRVAADDHGLGDHALRPAMDEVAAKRLLAEAGVRTVEERAVPDAGAAVAAAEAIGFPVVIKLLTAEVGHKSDLGLVEVGLRTDGEVKEAAERILGRAVAAGLGNRRLVVQAMVSSDLELILGMTRDPVFGPVIMVGVGGVLTELAADVQIRVPPLTEADAADMLDDLRWSALLDGPRGRTRVDRADLARTIVAFADAALASGLEALEVNPLLVSPDGRVVAVDALAVGAD
ncbi:acetate--CoA ligase family protein [Mariniluteicoccus flavus]